MFLNRQDDHKVVQSRILQTQKTNGYQVSIENPHPSTATLNSKQKPWLLCPLPWENAASTSKPIQNKHDGYQVGCYIM